MNQEENILKHSKDIGKSPMVLSKNDTAYRLIGTYFKIVHYLLIV